jgi:hypothetical protein
MVRFDTFQRVESGQILRLHAVEDGAKSAIGTDWRRVGTVLDKKLKKIWSDKEDLAAQCQRDGTQERAIWRLGQRYQVVAQVRIAQKRRIRCAPLGRRREYLLRQ